MPDEVRYAIGDLAELGGVSRRTVRYYVQEQLLPPPLGFGRGNHYGKAHLDRLLQVKAMQEAGRTLDEIRRALRSDGRPDARRAAAAAAAMEPSLPRSLWRRVLLAPGVELHVARDVRLPAPGKLNELSTWCRQHFATGTEDEHTRNEDGDA